MKLKELHFVDVAEIQETVTDELKKVQKEEFSAAFQKVYDRAKACIYANGAYFEQNKRARVFLMCLLKKISPKTFGPLCVEFTGFCSRVMFDYLRLFILHKRGEISLLLSNICKS
jgi:hypothetical protein